MVLAKRKINGSTRRSTRSCRSSESSIFGETYGWMRTNVSGTCVSVPRMNISALILALIGKPMNQDLIDVDAHLQIVIRRAHHDERIRSPACRNRRRPARIHSCRPPLECERTTPSRGGADGIFGEQRRRGRIGLRQSDVLFLLIAGCRSSRHPPWSGRIASARLRGWWRRSFRRSGRCPAHRGSRIWRRWRRTAPAWRADPARSSGVACAFSTCAAATSRFSGRGSAFSSCSIARAACACDCCCSAGRPLHRIIDRQQRVALVHLGRLRPPAPG